MKRLLIPLLAALALPNAVNAETIWLILAGAKSDGLTGLGKIEMPSMQACEAQGTKIRGDESFRRGVFDTVSYSCVRGK